MGNIPRLPATMKETRMAEMAWQVDLDGTCVWFVRQSRRHGVHWSGGPSASGPPPSSRTLMVSSCSVFNLEAVNFIKFEHLSKTKFKKKVKVLLLRLVSLFKANPILIKWYSFWIYILFTFCNICCKFEFVVFIISTIPSILHNHLCLSGDGDMSERNGINLVLGWCCWSADVYEEDKWVGLLNDYKQIKKM